MAMNMLLILQCTLSFAYNMIVQTSADDRIFMCRNKIVYYMVLSGCGMCLLEIFYSIHGEYVCGGMERTEINYSSSNQRTYFNLHTTETQGYVYQQIIMWHYGIRIDQSICWRVLDLDFVFLTCRSGKVFQ